MTSPFTSCPPPSARTYVLLHGWGVNGAVWTAMQGELDGVCYTPDLFEDFHWPSDAGGAERLVRDILERAPPRATWLGWSLGGMLAMLAARLAPERIENLILLASTPKFLADPCWNHGISEKTYAAFSAGLEDDLPATLKRFLLLNTGAGGQGRTLVTDTLRTLRARGLPSPAALKAGLGVLATLDLRALLASLVVPVTVVHGTHDRITPPGAARCLAEGIPGARLHMIAGAGHAPLLSHPGMIGVLARSALDRAT